MKNKKILTSVSPRGIKKYYIALSLALLICSCQTAPKQPFKIENQGRWKGKLLIEEKLKDKTKSSTLYYEVNAIKDKRLRLDLISGIIGHIASVLLDKGKISYIVPRKKKYYSGAMKRSSLNGILPIELNPRLLYRIFFFEKIKGKNWECQDLQKTFTCKQKRGSLFITWSKNFDKIHIDHPRADIKIHVSSYKPELHTRSGLFKIKRPKGW